MSKDSAPAAVPNDKAPKGNAKPESGEEPKGGRPGPVDSGKNGGMAMRELAPELTED